MRRLLRALAARNLLITYTVGAYTGQRIRVWGPDGLPRTMSPGTAKAYLQRLEAREWGVQMMMKWLLNLLRGCMIIWR
jgi:hypothetical protein